MATKKKFNLLSSINSPLPTNLAGECKKATKILNSFVDPGEGLDKIIPSSILEKAQGLAIFTVLKAGFLFSGRAGSGLVIARLPDGTFSAPCAIITGGVGAGGQIGAELTDFVLVLNTKEAVKTFSHSGTVTLGGNVSIAAGPIGRNAEASGSATFKHVSAIYSYSKTRGLFAGVSLEGSVIIARGDANEKLYGERYTPKQLLNGTVPAPREADSLYRALNVKFHTLGNTGTMYQRTIQKEEEASPKKTSTISAPGTLKIPPVRQAIGYGAPNLMIGPPPTSPSINSPYNSSNPAYNHSLSSSPSSNFGGYNHSVPSTPSITTAYSSSTHNSYNSDVPPSPSAPYPPTSPIPQQFSKPHQHDYDSPSQQQYSNKSAAPFQYTSQSQTNFDVKRKPVPAPLFDGQRINFSTEIKGGAASTPSAPPPPPPPQQQQQQQQKARALYAFASQEPGDLSFQVGDVIIVTEKTESQHDWWTGKLRGATGSFPANYVEPL